MSGDLASLESAAAVTAVEADAAASALSAQQAADAAQEAVAASERLAREEYDRAQAAIAEARIAAGDTIAQSEGTLEWQGTQIAALETSLQSLAGEVSLMRVDMATLLTQTATFMSMTPPNSAPDPEPPEEPEAVTEEVTEQPAGTGAPEPTGADGHETTGDPPAADPPKKRHRPRF